MVNKNTDAEDKIKTTKDPSIKLGLKPNTNQFLLLIVVNTFVGAMIGLNKNLLILDRKEKEKDAINNSNQYSQKYNKFYLHNIIIVLLLSII
jgi:hypothetical protein